MVKNWNSWYNSMNFSDELPSIMIPYNVRSINMELFGVAQFKLLSKALALNSMVPVIDAMSEVVDMDATLLTDGDYSYLLAYQRFNAMASSPLIASWTCDNVMMREQNGLGRLFSRSQIEKLCNDYDEASVSDRANMQDPNKLLLMSEICHVDNEQSVGLRDFVVAPLTKEPLDPRLDFPRLATLSESVVLRRDPELTNLVDIARWVKEGDTLREKFNTLEQQDDNDLMQAAMKARITHEHGVKKYVTKKCSACDAEHVSVFEAGPDIFFRV